MIRLLVTGGRTYYNRTQVYYVLSIIRPDVVIQGGARGADRLALEWAIHNRVPHEDYPVDHALDGPWPGAGHSRNSRMLIASRPNLGLAFPGRNGTADMTRKMIAAGLTVLQIR